jgi:hypothetical protein
MYSVCIILNSEYTVMLSGAPMDKYITLVHVHVASSFACTLTVQKEMSTSRQLI